MPDAELRPAARSPEGGTRIGTTDARQAVALGSVRYVLGVSLALALVAFVVLYFLYT